MTMKQNNGRLKYAGDLRTYLANIALAAMQDDDFDKQRAAIAVKACEQINASLYSETKIAAMAAGLGQAAYPLGALPIGRPDDVRALVDKSQGREAA